MSTIKSFIAASPDQPVADDFAVMLGKLFASGPHAPTKPRVLDQLLFTRDELKHATQQMKSDKACDELGVVAELVQYSSDGFMCCLLQLCNHVL